MPDEITIYESGSIKITSLRALEQTQNHILRERIMNSAKVIFSEDEAAYV